MWIAVRLVATQNLISLTAANTELYRAHSNSKCMFLFSRFPSSIWDIVTVLDKIFDERAGRKGLQTNKKWKEMKRWLSKIHLLRPSDQPSWHHHSNNILLSSVQFCWPDHHHDGRYWKPRVMLSHVPPEVPKASGNGLTFLLPIQTIVKPMQLEGGLVSWWTCFVPATCHTWNVLKVSWNLKLYRCFQDHC